MKCPVISKWIGRTIVIMNANDLFQVKSILISYEKTRVEIMSKLL